MKKLLLLIMFISGLYAQRASVIYGVDGDNKPSVAIMDDYGSFLFRDKFSGLSMARGDLSGYGTVHKFGENSDVDAGTEDVWTYGGFKTNLVTNEIINVKSTSTNDKGLVLSSGTATGGSTTTLIDSGATFQSDGVTAGDVLVNDTSDVHGIVKSVDSETQITLQVGMNRGSQVLFNNVTNNAGDVYRIVSPGGTGGSIIDIFGLDNDYNPVIEYIVLNGTSNVPTTNPFLRINRSVVIIAGSENKIVGNVTGTAAVSGSIQVYLVSDDGNKTEQTHYTIPAGKTGYLVLWNGSLEGTANVSCALQFLVAPIGEIYELVDEIGISASADSLFHTPIMAPIKIPEKSDLVVRAKTADNNVSVNISYDLLLIDNP